MACSANWLVVVMIYTSGVGEDDDLSGLKKQPGSTRCNHCWHLGLLTGRWLAQHGAGQLVLVSRSAKLASDTASEWVAVEASGVATLLER